MKERASRMNENDTSNIDNFRAELTALINRHSLENGSNTNDFVLADFLADCLVAFDKASNRNHHLAGYPERFPTGLL